MNRWMNGGKGQDVIHDPEVAIQRHKIIRTLKHKRTQIHNAAESSVAYGIPWMFQAFDLWMRRIFRSDAHKNGFSDHVISSWIRSLDDSELRSHDQIKKNPISDDLSSKSWSRPHSATRLSSRVPCRRLFRRLSRDELLK